MGGFWPSAASALANRAAGAWGREGALKIGAVSTAGEDSATVLQA